MTIKYDQAMHHGYAGKMYGCVDETYEGINWFEEDEPKPTREELEAIWETIKDVETNRALDDERKMAYPTTEELVVALWEKLVETDGLTSQAISDLQQLRLSVKQQFPKE